MWTMRLESGAHRSYDSLSINALRLLPNVMYVLYGTWLTATPLQVYNAACAAASRAIGTLGAEHDT
jgi:hypothetical protein